MMRELAIATKPLSLEQIARKFSQGKAVEKRVALTFSLLPVWGTSRRVMVERLCCFVGWREFEQ